MYYNKQIYIELTNNCNMNCDYCSKQFSERPSGYISLDTIDTIVEKISGVSNINRIYLSHLGESLLHPDIETICNKLSGDHDLILYTNGQALSSQHHNLNINAMYISLFGLNSGSHILRDSDYSYENYISDITGFITEEPPFHVCLMALYNSGYKDLYTDLNYDYMLDFTNRYSGSVDEINDFCQSISSNFDFNPYYDDGNIKVVHKINDDVDFCLMGLGYTDLNNPEINYLTGELSAGFECRRWRSQLCINISGSVSHCCMDTESENYIGDINNLNLNDVFDSKLTGYTELQNDFCKLCMCEKERIE